MVHEDFRKVSFAQHFVLLPSLLRSLQQQVSQAKMRTKIIRCFPPSFVFFLYYYFFNSSWAFRRTLLASIACNFRGWIISQERSRISNVKQRLYTPTTRRRIPSHSIDHNSLISASLSKVSLNSNAWTPELQMHTLFSLVSHLHLSESANFCSKLPTAWAVDRSGLTCFTLIGFSSQWKEYTNGNLTGGGSGLLTHGIVPPYCAIINYRIEVKELLSVAFVGLAI